MEKGTTKARGQGIPLSTTMDSSLQDAQQPPRSRRSATHSCHHGPNATSGRPGEGELLDKPRVQG